MSATTALSRVRQVRSLPPELRHPGLYLPLNITGPSSLGLARRLARRTTAPRASVSVTREVLPASAGDDAVVVFIYRRHAPSGPAPMPALMWFHPGGLILGSAPEAHSLCSQLADDLDIVVISVDYRLAPEHPFPAAHHDGVRALQWAHDNAGQLGVDPSRVAVGGQSGGGGLAATLAQRAHDEGLPLCFQLLVYPMLDDRTALRSTDPDHLFWSAASNAFAWQAYLGRPATRHDPRPYIAAARRDDLGGLPPTWIGIGTSDLFHHECLQYADDLSRAGVAVDVCEVTSMYHGADVLRPQAAAMTRFRQDMVTALADGLRPTQSPLRPPTKEPDREQF